MINKRDLEAIKDRLFDVIGMLNYDIKHVKEEEDNCECQKCQPNFWPMPEYVEIDCIKINKCKENKNG